MDDSHHGDEAGLRLQHLLEQARDNEEKLRLFNALELRLIAATSLAELFEHLIFDFPAEFNLEAVTLTLVDRDRELAGVLEESGLATPKLPQLTLVDSADELAQALPATERPCLGRFSPGEHARFFSAAETTPASIALLPLRRGAELLGSLNLGSTDPLRYEQANRTDFLQHLAAVVTICLENGVNHEKIRRLGMTDALTGVNNRRYFEQRLLEEFTAAQRHGHPLTCMFLDVDHFKRLNDRHGHHAGDEVLRKTAELIRALLRRSDTFCRYGGEEFVLLMPHAAERAGRETAERIRQAVAAHGFALPDEPSARITLSAGVAVVPGSECGRDDNPQLLVRAADRALYEAKAAGRNCVIVAGQAATEPATDAFGDLPPLY